MPDGSSRAMRAVLLAGLVAGTLDIVAAFVIYGWLGVGPVRILQSIAAGLLGADAARGGVTAAALGLVLQFVIATGAALAYFIGGRRLPALRERPIVWGAVYGVAVYAFMNFVVVPLSAVPKRPFNWRLAPLILFVHVVCVGIPIAAVLNRDRKLARQ